MNDSRQLDFQEFVTLLRVPPPATDRETCFAFSLHKAGSTLLYNMLQELAPRAGLTYFSIEDRRFALGYKPAEMPKNACDIFEPKGYLYGGFRYLEGFNSPLVRHCRKVLLVRHPLDILTSLYFSTTKSHISPGKRGTLLETFKKRRESASTMTIDEFAKRQSKRLFSRFIGYHSILSDHNLAMFRYEDIIYDKKSFLSQICRHYGWNIPENIVKATAAKHEQIPDIEKPDQHIRQVRPGNHLKHLAPDTRNELTAEFEPILRAFGYTSGKSPAHVVQRDAPVPR